MANLKKGDIVRMNYNASIIGSDVVFDTTYEDKAKEAGIFNEKYSYAPMPYIVGSGRFFKALDDAIAAAEVGVETTIEVPCQQAAGEKDPKLIAKFKEEPIKVVEQLLGVDISDEIVEKVVSGVKLAMASDKADDVLGALGALKKLF